MKNYLFYLFSIINVYFVVLSVASQSKSTNPLQTFLEHAKKDDPLKISDFINAIKSLDSTSNSKIDGIDKSRTQMGKILNEYAKSLLHGKLNGGNPDLKTAFYFFKLASQFGSSESLYYLSFYSYYNLDGRFLYLNNYKTLEKSEHHGYFENYISKMNATTLLTNAYLSSLQGYNTSTFLMAGLYWNGKGVKASCTSAALYYKKLAQMYFVEDEINDYYSPELLEKKRLDEIYFNDQDLDIEGFYKDSPHELQYYLMSAELGRIPHIVHLAHTYYYGLRGEKRDLQKAFDYFYKAANLGDLSSKAVAGRMLMEGVGIERNIQAGLALLREAEMKNNPKAKNAMGKLYYLGEYVGQNEKLAVQYFKEAAYANYTDGQYNYGVALMKNEKDRETGMKWINAAATQGHTLAMFHLGLIYLEGSELYYSCDVGVSLLKTACERGPWSRILRDGYFAYQQKKFKLALVYYMEAAFLGYDVANMNGALIAEKYKIFKDKDLDIHSVKKDIHKDPIWVALSETKNFQPPQNTNEVLFDDMLDVLQSLKYDENKKEQILEKLTKPFEDVGLKYNIFLTLLMLRTGADLQEPLSALKLGDLYQEGKIVERNYTRAYEYYTQLDKVLILQNHPKLLSYAFYNIAYMNHYGMGRDKNLTKAISFYNLSLTLKNTNYYLVTLNMKLAELEKAYFEEYLNTTKDSEVKPDITINDFIKHKMTQFEEKYAKKIFLVFFIVAAFVLFLLRMRLKNYVDLYLKQHSHSHQD